MSTSCLQDNFLTIFPQNLDPKEGRRPKAAAPFLVAAGGRDHILSKYCQQVILGQYFDTFFFDNFEAPEDKLFEDFPRVLPDGRF